MALRSFAGGSGWSSGSTSACRGPAGWTRLMLSPLRSQAVVRRFPKHPQTVSQDDARGPGQAEPRDVPVAGGVIAPRPRRALLVGGVGGGPDPTAGAGEG